MLLKSHVILTETSSKLFHPNMNRMSPTHKRHLSSVVNPDMTCSNLYVFSNYCTMRSLEKAQSMKIVSEKDVSWESSYLFVDEWELVFFFTMANQSWRTSTPTVVILLNAASHCVSARS